MRTLRFAPPLVIVLLAATGCENSIQPYAGDAVPYSVYGTLSFKNNEQFVRVKPFQTPVHAVAGESPPVNVRVTELSTGQTYHLKDSLITFGQETKTHNYRTRFDIRPQTEYELAVEGPDGRKTRATTITPTSTEALIQPSGHTPGPPSDTVRADSGDLHCLTVFTILFREAKVPYKSSVGLEIQGEYFWIPVSFAIDDLESGVKGYRIQLESLLRYAQVESRNEPFPCRYFTPRCQVLSSPRIQVAYTYVGPEWFGNRPPKHSEDGFDPTTSTQIDNGIGFFGSYFRDTLSVSVHRGVIDLGPEACRPGF